MWVSQFTDEKTEAQRGSHLSSSPTSGNGGVSCTCSLPDTKGLFMSYCLFPAGGFSWDHREAPVLSEGGLETSLTFSAALAPRLAHSGELAGRREWGTGEAGWPHTPERTGQPEPDGTGISQAKEGKGGQTPCHSD